MMINCNFDFGKICRRSIIGFYRVWTSHRVPISLVKETVLEDRSSSRLKFICEQVSIRHLQATLRIVPFWRRYAGFSERISVHRFLPRTDADDDVDVEHELLLSSISSSLSSISSTFLKIHTRETLQTFSNNRHLNPKMASFERNDIVEAIPYRSLYEIWL